ncbi:nucleotidyltransferase domain-containing protein [Actinoplanes sp. NEAU-H7]|uniref:Nucleotidyltransferase domain-containing protein n=1 Tax=Actinoplanes flavus TaxID=2820290 RepID=A0ABS3UFM3_9ACTN|nr:nucleotidyltransferase domain-containing protein [Actinoplanes flavus]
MCRACGRPGRFEVCPGCGGEAIRRPDDSPETVARRLSDYHRRRALIPAGTPRLRVDAIPPPGQVAAAISEVPALAEFGRLLARLDWVTGLYVAGSLATGDYRPGVSDLDLVAAVDGPVTDARDAALTALHRQVDAAFGGTNLGCVYVDVERLTAVDVRHPTWTHGLSVRRVLSGITRAELVRHGFTVFGRPPREVFPPMSDDAVRAAARDELTGYWAWAARRPWLWCDPVIADLGLTSMARGRHALRTGTLLTKSAAIEQAAAPPWLIAHLRARRRGSPVVSPRWRTALITWRDARRTVREAQPSVASSLGRE